MGQPVCPAKLLEADQIRVPMPLNQEQDGQQGLGNVLEPLIGVALGSGDFGEVEGWAKGPPKSDQAGLPGLKVWMRSPYLGRTTHAS